MPIVRASSRNEKAARRKLCEAIALWRYRPTPLGQLGQEQTKAARIALNGPSLRRARHIAKRCAVVQSGVARCVRRACKIIILGCAVLTTSCARKYSAR